MATSSFFDFFAGILFGLALFASGVYQPQIILSQLRLDSFHVVTTMLGASASTALVLYAADRTNFVIVKPPPPSQYGFFAYDGNVIGGALIGLGMAFTGACPGTALVQAGVGLKSGMIVTLGGLGGGLAFSMLRPLMLQKPETPFAKAEVMIANLQPIETPTLASLLGVDPGTVLALWIPFCLTIIYLTVTFDSSLSSIGNAQVMIAPLYSGITIGLAQASSLLLNRHAIGVSGAYADIGNWITQYLPGCASGAKCLITPAVTFAIGMTAGAAVLGRVVFPNLVASDPTQVDAVRALGGGFAMILGARIAGGCTSGHAITGMASFGLASFVTTGAMFAAGIVGAAVL
ncbi:hypothetical protein MBLNU230_g8594t1 [Neophaeotheca triangularis]